MQLKPCGTAAAYQRHITRGETPCTPCRQANTAYGQAYLQQRAAGITTTRELKPCGTKAAYQRHLRRGQYPCQECVEAMRRYSQARRDRKAMA